MVDTSAAWVLGVLVVVAGLVGALLLTVTDPVMQELFASSMWDASTTTGSDTLRWQKTAWTKWPVMILIGLMLTVWIKTRQPG